MLTEEKKTGIKEYDALKASVATLAGANSDGQSLFLNVQVFDGEHTNEFETIWPVKTTAEEVKNYLKSIIEKNPKVDAEIVGLMQKKIYFDQTEKEWYIQAGNEKPVRLEPDSK